MSPDHITQCVYTSINIRKKSFLEYSWPSLNSTDQNLMHLLKVFYSASEIPWIQFTVNGCISELLRLKLTKLSAPLNQMTRSHIKNSIWLWHEKDRNSSLHKYIAPLGNIQAKLLFFYNVKEVKFWEIIVTPLIITLSRGHIGEIKVQS